MQERGLPATAERSGLTRARPALPVSGHVFRVERKRGPVWYAKYRLPDGRQVQRKLGPAWTGRGRPAGGYLTKRLAEELLRDDARPGAQGHAPRPRQDRSHGSARRRPSTCATSSTTANASPRPSQGYRWLINAQILPALGELPIEDVTTEQVEALARPRSVGARAAAERPLVLLHGIFKRARKLHRPADQPGRGRREAAASAAGGDIEVLRPEEVWALVRAAASEQDAAIFLTAAFTGLRMGELLALRWRDVDFAGFALRVRASYYAGALTSPKSGKVRSVPLAPEVASALARLSQREMFIGEDDLVFVGDFGTFLDGSAMRRRYKAALARAGLRQLRFHDLRHTFGTRMIAKADIRRVQEWMGHADIQTTMRYLHYAPRAEDAQLVAEAFEVTESVDALPVPDLAGHAEEVPRRP